MANLHPDVEACLRSQSPEYRKVVILLSTLRLLHHQAGGEELPPPMDVIFISYYTTAGVFLQYGWAAESCCHQCSTKVQTSIDWTIKQLAASVPIGGANFNMLLDGVL